MLLKNIEEKNTRKDAKSGQCDALIQAGLGDRLLLATDEEYEPRIASWWSLSARLRPWCLVQPQDAGEVSAVMTALLGTEAGNGAGDWHIAIRAGGHGPRRSNNIDNGVTIDLGMLNQATYDAETNLASIGAGGRACWYLVAVTVTWVWADFLGGGSTYFMGREAFACDSVRNFEVVLTNGTIVNANRGENADLWLALKGGGSNFGIVTRFDMEALPNKKLAYGNRFMSADYSSDLVDVIVHFTDHYQEFEADALVAFLMHNTSAFPVDVVAAAIHVNTDGIHKSAGFEKLNQIPSLIPDETISISLADAAEDSQLPSGSWTAGATLTFKNDKRILTYAVELHDRYVQDLNDAIGKDNFVTYAFFQPMPSFFGDISNKKGGNMLGMDSQAHNAILWTGGVAVTTNQEELAIAQTRMNAMVAELRSFSVSLEADSRLVYMNYADLSQDPLRSYGEANVDHISRVAAKYDPFGEFQRRFPGGFKISRVGV
ncbi:hypothetical protein AJ78_04020 [Emergomyces pasteurianus Ep9510]|uniref:FAD-binding PCMH-type domain-containing protein n=1 Tax=Emergomyces pasteurianus Ep9510 TaxID=1447872 RepID=A0A1J9Q6B0_9EURO|nr:hypothetical protein AJ78_04020 [Emergomyces pasteurianus Ep9510]